MLNVNGLNFAESSHARCGNGQNTDKQIATDDFVIVASASVKNLAPTCMYVWLCSDFFRIIGLLQSLTSMD